MLVNHVQVGLKKKKKMKVAENAKEKAIADLFFFFPDSLFHSVCVFTDYIQVFSSYMIGLESASLNV